MKTSRLKDNSCPYCGHGMDAAAHSEGCFTFCINCLETLQFNEDLIPVKPFEKIELAVQVQLNIYKSMMEKAKEDVRNEIQ